MFRNISLKTQLGVGFSLVVAIFLAVLMVVAMLLNRLDQGVVRVSEESLPLMLAVDQMDLARSEVQQFLTDVSATHDPAAYAEAAESAKNFHDGAAAFRRFFEHSGDQNRLAQLAAVEASFDAFYASGKAMAEAYLNQGLEAGNLLMKGSPGQPGFDQASEDLSQRLSAFRDQQLQLTRRDTEDDRAAATTMQHAMLWGGLAATLVAIAAAGLIVRAILNQFGAEPRVVVKFVQRIGTGNLSTPIHVRPGDQDSLMAQLQTMQHNLRDVVATVREKAQVVERASVDIESGSADLSGRTAGQAASLEETAASMEELNARVRQNLDGARHAEQLAASASTSAKQGGELVAQFVDTMQGINEASRKIAEIIGVIDGIAFQTNILALNAAVEAARAGEQGRGFAVVASEVRTLAGRSAEAAKAIKVLIGDSVARVDDGSALVARARSAMTTVVEDIRQVSQAMGDITTASAEQSASVAQVSESVHRMDQVTQQNAALVDASATSAMDLRRQAHELTEAMAVFTLSPDATAPSAVAAHSGAGLLPVGAPA